MMLQNVISDCHSLKPRQDLQTMHLPQLKWNCTNIHDLLTPVACKVMQIAFLMLRSAGHYPQASLLYKLHSNQLVTVLLADKLPRHINSV